MRKHITLLIILLLALVGCEKMDPAPELKDPIYKDLQDQLSSAQKQLSDEIKVLSDHNKALTAVVPQTGQIKYAKKRVFDSQNRISRFEQQVMYWKIRIVERQKHTRREYAQAFHSKKEWPRPEEYQQYLSEKRLRAAKNNWDSRERIENAKAQSRTPSQNGNP